MNGVSSRTAAAMAKSLGDLMAEEAPGTNFVEIALPAMRAFGGGGERASPLQLLPSPAERFRDAIRNNNAACNSDDRSVASLPTTVPRRALRNTYSTRSVKTEILRRHSSELLPAAGDGNNNGTATTATTTTSTKHHMEEQSSPTQRRRRRWKKSSRSKTPIQDQMIADFFNLKTVDNTDPATASPPPPPQAKKSRFNFLRTRSSRSVWTRRDSLEEDAAAAAAAASGPSSTSRRGSMGSQSMDSLPSQSTTTTHNDGTPRFLIQVPNLSYLGVVEDDDLTLASDFIVRPPPLSSPCAEQYRGKLRKTASERFTNATGGPGCCNSSGGKSKRIHRKNFLNRLFGRRHNTNSKTCTTCCKANQDALDWSLSEDQSTQLSPTEDMDCSLASLDCEPEQSQTNSTKDQRTATATPRVVTDSRLTNATNPHQPSYGLSSRRRCTMPNPVATANNHQDDEMSENGSVLSMLAGLLDTYSTEETKGNEDEGDENNNGEEKQRPDDVAVWQLKLPQAPNRGCIKKETISKAAAAGYRVCWSVVCTREFERTVGDNPACTSGPPITLGWAYYDVAPDELVETHAARPKRTKREFHLPAAVRSTILMEEWQVTEMDIRKARREATYVQYCREKSAFTGVRGVKEASFLRRAQHRKQQMQGLGTGTTGANNEQPPDASDNNNLLYTPYPGSMPFDTQIDAATQMEIERLVF